MLQANIRVNTPNAYAAYQNISSSLGSVAATATEVRFRYCRRAWGVLFCETQGGFALESNPCHVPGHVPLLLLRLP